MFLNNETMNTLKYDKDGPPNSPIINQFYIYRIWIYFHIISKLFLAYLVICLKPCLQFLVMYGVISVNFWFGKEYSVFKQRCTFPRQHEICVETVSCLVSCYSGVDRYCWFVTSSVCKSYISLQSSATGSCNSFLIDSSLIYQHAKYDHEKTRWN